MSSTQAFTYFSVQAAGGSSSGVGVNGSYLAKTGDTFVLASSDSGMNMRLGILQIITEPLIGA